MANEFSAETACCDNSTQAPTNNMPTYRRDQHLDAKFCILHTIGTTPDTNMYVTRPLSLREEGIYIFYQLKKKKKNP